MKVQKELDMQDMADTESLELGKWNHSFKAWKKG